MKLITGIPIFPPGTIWSMEPEEGGIAAHTLIVHYEQCKVTERIVHVMVSTGGGITYDDQFVKDDEGNWHWNENRTKRQHQPSWMASNWKPVE